MTHFLKQLIRDHAIHCRASGNQHELQGFRRLSTACCMLYTLIPNPSVGTYTFFACKNVPDLCLRPSSTPGCSAVPVLGMPRTSCCAVMCSRLLFNWIPAVVLRALLRLERPWVASPPSFLDRLLRPFHLGVKFTIVPQYRESLDHAKYFIST